MPVEQKEKQELLKQVSEEAGDILQKVNTFKIGCCDIEKISNIDIEKKYR